MIGKVSWVSVFIGRFVEKALVRVSSLRSRCPLLVMVRVCMLRPWARLMWMSRFRYNVCVTRTAAYVCEQSMCHRLLNLVVAICPGTGYRM